MCGFGSLDYPEISRLEIFTANANDYYGKFLFVNGRSGRNGRKCKCGAETRSPCVALSGETTLYHRSRGRERPQGRGEDRRKARKVSGAERRSCGAASRVRNTHRTGGGRESRLRRFVGEGVGCPPVL